MPLLNEESFLFLSDKTNYDHINSTTSFKDPYLLRNNYSSTNSINNFDYFVPPIQNFEKQSMLPREIWENNQFSNHYLEEPFLSPETSNKATYYSPYVFHEAPYLMNYHNSQILFNPKYRSNQLMTDSFYLNKSTPYVTCLSNCQHQHFPVNNINKVSSIHKSSTASSISIPIRRESSSTTNVIRTTSIATFLDSSKSISKSTISSPIMSVLPQSFKQNFINKDKMKYIHDSFEPCLLYKELEDFNNLSFMEGITESSKNEQFSNIEMNVISNENNNESYSTTFIKEKKKYELSNDLEIASDDISSGDTMHIFRDTFAKKVQNNFNDIIINSTRKEEYKKTETINETDISKNETNSLVKNMGIESQFILSNNDSIFDKNTENDTNIETVILENNDKQKPENNNNYHMPFLDDDSYLFFPNDKSNDSLSNCFEESRITEASLETSKDFNDENFKEQTVSQISRKLPKITKVENVYLNYKVVQMNPSTKIELKSEMNSDESQDSYNSKIKNSVIASTNKITPLDILNNNQIDYSENKEELPKTISNSENENNVMEKTFSVCFVDLGNKKVPCALIPSTYMVCLVSKEDEDISSEVLLLTSTHKKDIMPDNRDCLVLNLNANHIQKSIDEIPVINNQNECINTNSVLNEPNENKTDELNDDKTIVKKQNTELIQFHSKEVSNEDITLNYYESYTNVSNEEEMDTSSSDFNVDLDCNNCEVSNVITEENLFHMPKARCKTPTTSVIDNFFNKMTMTPNRIKRRMSNRFQLPMKNLGDIVQNIKDNVKNNIESNIANNEGHPAEKMNDCSDMLTLPKKPREYRKKKLISETTRVTRSKINRNYYNKFYANIDDVFLTNTLQSNSSRARRIKKMKEKEKVNKRILTLTEAYKMKGVRQIIKMFGSSSQRITRNNYKRKMALIGKQKNQRIKRIK